jgi:hypothetical protein
MKWTPWLFGSLTACLIAGCGGERRNTDTGATSGTMSDTSTMRGGAPSAARDTTGMGARTDTGMTGPMNADSARTGSRMHKDTTGKSSTRP